MDHASGDPDRDLPNCPQNHHRHNHLPPTDSVSLSTTNRSQGGTGQRRQSYQSHSASASRNGSEVGGGGGVGVGAGHRSPAASLIQSAARSILDDATPSTAGADDSSESGFAFSVPRLNYHSNSNTPTIPPSLQSLQVETLPALPDEQDRKRFLVRTRTYVHFVSKNLSQCLQVLRLSFIVYHD
jgi:hypothetical protein